MTLKEIAHNFDVELNFGSTINNSVHASLTYLETLNGGLLTSAVGFGRTRGSALKNLAKKLSNATIVYRAYSPERREMKTLKVTVK